MEIQYLQRNPHTVQESKAFVPHYTYVCEFNIKTILKHILPLRLN